MNGGREESTLVGRWIAKAENDLLNAEHTLLLGDDCPFDTVCFHAQQCAEKYLKALLVFHGLQPPRVHDLRLLVQKLPAETASRFDLPDLLALNRYSVEARYPGEWEPIQRDDAAFAIQAAKAVRDLVRALVS